MYTDELDRADLLLSHAEFLALSAEQILTTVGQYAPEQDCTVSMVLAQLFSLRMINDELSSLVLKWQEAARSERKEA